jgi:hypothetical protein
MTKRILSVDDKLTTRLAGLPVELQCRVAICTGLNLFDWLCVSKAHHRSIVSQTAQSTELLLDSDLGFLYDDDDQRCMLSLSEFRALTAKRLSLLGPRQLSLHFDWTVPDFGSLPLLASSLQSLTLETLHWHKAGAPASCLPQVLPQMTALRRLELIDMVRDRTDLCPLLSTLTNLEALSVSHYAKYGGDRRFLAPMTRLRHLQLGGYERMVCYEDVSHLQRLEVLMMHVADVDARLNTLSSLTGLYLEGVYDAETEEVALPDLAGLLGARISVADALSMPSPPPLTELMISTT